MKRVIAAGILALLLALCVVETASAVGPNDGIYNIVLWDASGVVLPGHYGSVTQTGPTFVLINFFKTGTWTYGIGTIIQETFVFRGSLYRPNDVQYGTFDLTRNGATITGSAWINGRLWFVSANRVF